MLCCRLIAVILLGAALSQAQAPAKQADPEVIGVIYSLDPVSHELRRVPNELWKSHFSRFPPTDHIRIEGTAAKFRFAGGDKITLVFSTVAIEAIKVRMYRCEIKDGRRDCEHTKYQGGQSVDRNVSASLSKYGTDSFKLTPDQSLEPGEYTAILGNAAYTFGVDAAK